MCHRAKPPLCLRAHTGLPTTLVRALALHLRLRGYFFLCVTFFLSGFALCLWQPVLNPRTNREHTDAESPPAKNMKDTKYLSFPAPKIFLLTFPESPDMLVVFSGKRASGMVSYA